MHLDLRGHPLHTRSLSITLTQRADGRLDAHGEIVDLRKRGFVPVAGELQPSGVVHHMLLDGEIDPRTAVLEAIALRQPSVAFEATAVTGGGGGRPPPAPAPGPLGAPPPAATAPPAVGGGGGAPARARSRPR